MTTYVYAITRDSHPLKLGDRTGVGEQPAKLRTVRADGLAAVVSDAPENLRAKRRDLLAHETVLEELMTGGPMLPMRFGMVAPDDETVERELAARAKSYDAILADLEGRAEFNVKAFHREEAVLRELLTQNEELRRANEALRRAGGGDHQERMAFGERVAVALEERRAADGDRMVSILRQHAVRVSLGPPVDGAFVNASLLVGEDERPALEETVNKLRDEVGWLMELNLYGPLPPYSFVQS